MARDTVFSDTPAIHDGSTMAQFFVGKDTLICDAYGIKSQTQFNNTLYHNIKTRGAMDTIITDGGKFEISKKVAGVLWSLFINQYQSEPYHQHQINPEQCYGAVKRFINTLMNLTGAPAHCWLLCLVSVCSFLNVTTHLPLMESPIFKLSLDKYLTTAISYILLSGSLFTTR